MRWHGVVSDRCCTAALYRQEASAYKAETRMIKIVVGEVIDRDALCRQTVPGVQIERKERRHRGAGVVREVVPADLTVVVGKPVLMPGYFS